MEAMAVIGLPELLVQPPEAPGLAAPTGGLQDDALASQGPPGQRKKRTGTGSQAMGASWDWQLAALIEASRQAGSVVAWATDLNPEADSHLVAIQADNAYRTQTINIEGRQRLGTAPVALNRGKGMEWGSDGRELCGDERGAAGADGRGGPDEHRGGRAYAPSQARPARRHPHQAQGPHHLHLHLQLEAFTGWRRLLADDRVPGAANAIRG